MLELSRVKVNLQERSYNIYIGQELVNNFPFELSRISNSRQVILTTNDLVFGYYGKELQEGLEKAGFHVLTQIIPDGEEYKTWEMAEKIISSILKEKFNRDAIMVALGGGVVGDLAGFVAAIYQRGIDFVQIPTTLLAQVDSSVGGKVAVNHSLGKNMIGAFYQPLGVWVDLNTLLTLPEREWRAGLAEVVKYGVIWDKDFFEFLENNLLLVKERNLQVVQEIVSRSCRIKAEIVGNDEREKGLRAILNFGHTIGHALENVTEYKLYRHGEAVAIGMVGAAKLAVSLNMCSHVDAERIKSLLVQLELSIDLPSWISLDALVEAMSLDKKVREEQLVFILPKRVGQVEIVKGIDREAVTKCLVSSD